jgi:hypothetical protein
MIVALVIAFTDIPSGTSSMYFSMSFFGLGFFLQIVFSLSFACPRCGKSPYAIGPNWGPFAFAGKPWPDDKCSKCGFDFTAPYTPDRN